MAFCKHCNCGHTIIFEQMGGAPLLCPNCKRRTMFLKEELYVEPAPEPEPLPVPEPAPEPIPEPVPEPTPEPIPEPIPEPTPEPEPAPVVRKEFLITLESPDGELVLPVREKLVVGRNAAGKEYLGRFPDVTREHLTITPRANGITATLTDNGRWGTHVNGTRMVKGSSIVVSNYSEIRLASKAILLVRVKEVEVYDD